MSNQKHFIILTLDCEEEIRTYVVSANTKIDAENKVIKEIGVSNEEVCKIQEVKIRKNLYYTDPFTNTRFNFFTPNEEGVQREGIVIPKYFNMWDRIISKNVEKVESSSF